MQMDEKTMNAFRNLQNLQSFMMPHLSSSSGQLTGPNMDFSNINSNIQPAAFNNQGSTFKKRVPPKKEEEDEDEEGRY